MLRNFHRTGRLAAGTVALVVSTCVARFAPGAEPWADPRLPVVEGLELWLDAIRAAGAQPPAVDQPLAAWRDGSGRGRDVLQPKPDAQPKLEPLGPVAVVRFDGVDDFLSAAEQDAELESFTVALVAAPRVNFNAFAGFLALARRDQRDFESGLALDLGPAPTQRFSRLNVEGRGFGGVQNLRTQESAFGRLATLVVRSDAAEKNVQLRVDGRDEGRRPRDGAAVSLDEISVGARRFNNAGGSQRPTGFLRGEIAEVLVFSRALTPAEIAAVERYFGEKYAAVREKLPADFADGAAPLEPVADPPAVQMFLPGFTVRELPVALTNINNVKYRPDGALMALAYDGKVWILTDRDGDGVEEHAELFWNNDAGVRAAIGMDLTPPGYAAGDGVFLVAKTQCLLVVDTDRDGRADKVVELAGGWKESFHNVDGLGVAFDARDGSVYYGRGTYNFADPLLRDEKGQPAYRLTDEGGSIVRVAPDFKSRKVVATGIRFPVALRFNAEGDLFATDQEGATWVPNGNPLDELLHIQTGRHYGFPSRHPKFLPDVIDEPSTFDYRPQHQSTCGLNFNEPVTAGGPVFGPPRWRGDALVAGYSRGKLYRTELVKTDVGYVARNHLLGTARMLTVDACVSPRGELVIACHSGGPDWGSGPSGVGRLFKVIYDRPELPLPALVWPAGPREVRVEFDRPVDPRLLGDVLARTRLTGGRAVYAGDRFETLWPGYAMVQQEKLAPRLDVPLRSAQATPDGRTLVLATDPIEEAVHYALELPGLGRPDPQAQADPRDLPQHAAVDLDFDLSGCEAAWQPAGGGAGWSGWLPHPDLAVSRRLTAGSATHDRLWAALESPGELTLRCRLDLVDMLRPAVQPGSKLDFTYPPESPTVEFAADENSKLTLVLPKAAQRTPHTPGRAGFTLRADGAKLVEVELRLKTAGAGAPTLTVWWTTNEDDRRRPLALRRVALPWSKTPGAATAPPTGPPPEIAGGDWGRGFREFYGPRAQCGKCHAIHGRGGSIGPNLSNLAHRDYASVLRDITQPSFALNPDHLSSVVRLKDGRSLVGIVRATDDAVAVVDSQAATTTVARADVEAIEASPLSTMPEGLVKPLAPNELRDLMTFLLEPPPAMPRDAAEPRPAPRPRAEVEAALAGAPETPPATRPLRLVTVTSEKDHAPGAHDYPAWKRVWGRLLSAAPDVVVDAADDWPSRQQWETCDVAILYQRGRWTPERAADVDAHLKRGRGLVLIHWSVKASEDPPACAQRIGLAAGEVIAYRHGDLSVEFNTSVAHPVTRNFSRLKLVDETYWNLVGQLPADRILATVEEEDAPRPQVWSVEHGRSRVFVSIPGHFSWTFDDPVFRVLLLRGIAWAAHEPVDRFNDLVWPGADVTE